MTRRQANLISDMIRSQTTAAFHDARRELLESCEEQKSDAAALQPSVTVTATSSQSEPVQPSTPQPVGFDYKRSLLEGEKKTTLSMYMGAVENANKLQAEVKSLKEVICSQDGKIASLKESVENRTKKIESLKNQVELLVQRIKEDREHWDGVQKHNDELVAANAEIYESLRHWGLEQTGQCSLVGNVKQVICLCDKRGEEIEQMADTIAKLRNERDSDEASYIKKLTHKSMRISVLKKVGNDLCAAIKPCIWKPDAQEELMVALRNWENEAL